MKELLRIVNELQNNTGKNDKKRIIKDNLNNEIFVETMQFLLNSYIVTGLSKKKINRKVAVLDMVTEIPINITGLFNYLKQHNTGSDYDIYVIQQGIQLISDGNKEVEDMLKQLATKELKLGVSAKSWNEVVSEDMKIPVFEVMLAKSYTDHGHKVKGDFVITQKLDGSRILAIKQNGKVKCYTRQGKEYIGLNEIEKEIENIDMLDNYVFDGEILADVQGDTNEVFAETIKKTRTKDENKTGLKFHVFDMMPLEEFQNGKSKLNAIERKKQISNMFNDIILKHLVEVEPLYIGSDKDKIQEFANYAREEGFEGCMVNMDKPYVCKRTDYLLKVKEFQTVDLKIIGFEEGEGRLSGTLGRINVEYKDNIVGCGSGFSDSDREFFWDNRDELIGRIIEVSYFEETTDSKTGMKSLRFPVYKCLRDDKDEPSYN